MDNHYNPNPDEHENYETFASTFDFASLGSILNGLNSGAGGVDQSKFLTQIGKINHAKFGNKTTTNNYNYCGDYPPPPNTQSKKTNTDDDDLSEIISTVSRRIEGKWSELAEKLGLQKDRIEEIRENYCGDRLEDALHDMAKNTLLQWKNDNAENATRNNLISALRLIKADDIMN